MLKLVSEIHKVSKPLPQIHSLQRAKVTLETPSKHHLNHDEVNITTNWTNGNPVPPEGMQREEQRITSVMFLLEMDKLDLTMRKHQMNLN